MKHVWKRFWRLGSLAALATGAMAMAASIGHAQNAIDGPRHNELTLAGLRPGVSKLPNKERKMRGFRSPSLTDATGVFWVDEMDGRMLSVEAGSNQTVQTVTVSLLGAQVSGEWKLGNETALRRELRSGRGLTLGDMCARTTELYGKPESRGPSVRGSHKLESLFYSFDWAGEDVPQSMEISCDPATGRVVEITLAAATL